MAATFSELFSAFKDLSKTVYDQNKDRSAVKILKSTVKSLETVLKAMDAFLKKKNIDVGAMVDKGKEMKDSLLEKTTKFLKDSKDKGLKDTIKQRSSDVKTKLSDKFSSLKQKIVGPPKDAQEASGDPQVSLVSKLNQKLTEQTNIFVQKLEDLNTKFNPKKLENNKEASESKEDKPKKPSWSEKLMSRIGKRKSETDAEKKAVQDNMNDKKKKSKSDTWLGKILGGLLTLGSTITGGLWSATKFLGGFLFKGLGKQFLKLLPGLSGGIAKALQSVIARGAVGAGKLAWEGVKVAGRAALPFLKTAGTGLLRAGAMLATGPVGWAIAAGTAIYAGYKLYKYLTRNNVSSDVYGKLTMLRLYMYGFNETNKQYFSKLFDLEMVMKDFIKYKDHRIEITKLDEDAIEKVLDIFDVKREEKEKYAIMNRWFMKRFIPAYKAFMESLYSVNSSVYLDNIDSLKPGNLSDFMMKFKVPTVIFDITEVPNFDNPKTLVVKQDVDTLITNINNDIAAKLPKEKTAAEKAKEDNEKAKAKVAIDNKPETKPTTQSTPVPVGTSDKPMQPTSGSQADKKSTQEPKEEGEDKPKEGGALDSVTKKTAGKLNSATGSLMAGGGSLENLIPGVDKTKITNLNPNILELLTGMAKEYNTLTGKKIPVNEAFRTFQDQQALQRKRPGFAAKPGTSLHEHGLAVDVDSVVVAELEKLGLLRKYGFTASVGGEPWHLEPIGVSIDPQRSKREPNFANSAIMASPGNGGGGYGLDKGSKRGKRDIGLQMSIYNSKSDNPIDLSKVAEKSKDSPSQQIATGKVPEKTQILNEQGTTTTPGAMGNANQSTSPQETYSTSSETTKMAAISTQRKPDMGVSPESETKPTVVRQKSPLYKQEKTPSLDEAPQPVGVQGNPNADIGKYTDLPPEKAIKQAAKLTGVNESTMTTFAKMESGMNPNAKAKTSSATGLFQIIDSTWKELMNKHAAKYNIPPNADRTNPYYNSLMAGEFMKSNLQAVSNYKQTDMQEPTAAYLAHFLGAGGAKGLINTYARTPDVLVKNVVGEKAYKANQSLFGNKTVDQFVDTIDNKIAKAAGTSVDAYTGSKRDSKPKTEETPTSVSKTPVQASTATTPTTDPVSTPTETKPTTTSIGSTNYSTSSKVVDTPTPTKPEISANKFDMASPRPTIQQSTAKDIPTPQPQQQMLNLGKTESLLSDQLSSLKDIVGILSTINEKLDLNKLKEALPSTPSTSTETSPNKQNIPPIDRNPAFTSINLSRKRIVT